MTVGFVVADATTGAVKRFGSCHARDVALQAQIGEVAVTLDPVVVPAQVASLDVSKFPPVPITKT